MILSSLKFEIDEAGPTHADLPRNGLAIVNRYLKGKH